MSALTRRRALAPASCALVLLVAVTSGHPALAAQAPPPLKACTLLTKAEVKKVIGGNRAFDMFEPEEEAVAGGSSCQYPGVMIQVLAFTQGTIDAARKRGGLQPVTGLGDEAYLFANPAGYAELYVKVGRRLLKLQRNIDNGQTVESVRLGVVALANLLIPKLR